MALVEVVEVIRDVAQVCKRCPTGTLVAAYVRAARRFCHESRWYRSALPGQTAVDVSAYSMGSDPYEEIVGIRAMSVTQASGNTSAVGVGDSSGWPSQGARGMPQRYCYIPEGQFALYPLPDAVYTLALTVVLQPKAGQTKVAEALLVKWDQALQSGALGYLLALPGEPWANGAEAERHRRAFQAAISNAKADEQRSFNAGSVRARPRPFVV